MLKDLILKNRSYRRFDQNYKIEMSTLVELVELARLSATGANMQPLKFILCCDPHKNERVFSTLAWAGYLKDWGGPQPGERPTAYIIILGDKEIRNNVTVDHGIAAQSMLLGAVEKGLGGCMIGSIRREDLRKYLDIPERFDILLVIALGKPVEIVQIDPVGENGDIKYWRDEQNVHHVPKRSLEELIVSKFG